MEGKIRSACARQSRLERRLWPISPQCLHDAVNMEEEVVEAIETEGERGVMEVVEATETEGEREVKEVVEATETKGESGVKEVEGVDRLRRSLDMSCSR